MSQSVFIRQLVRMSIPGGIEHVTADYVRAGWAPGFNLGVVNGKLSSWHIDDVLKTWKVTREVDRDGHPQDEVVEEI